MDEQRVDSAGNVIRDTKQPWYKFDVGDAARHLSMPFVQRFRFSLKSLIAVAVIVFIASAYWMGYDRGVLRGGIKGFASGAEAKDTAWKDRWEQREGSHKAEIANLNKTHGLAVKRYKRSLIHMDDLVRELQEAVVARGAKIKSLSPLSPGK